MFDIGFLELVVVAAVGLVIIGPEKLPGAIRTVAIWIGTIRRTLGNARAEFERQIGADEIRREIHNEQVLASLRAAKSTRDEIQNKLNNLATDSLKSAESTNEPENGGENSSPATPDKPASTTSDQKTP
ncbi:Sec-independent protein translocase protein TatB [Teredinibacter turnerae]|uniref:Sec-independent protein translocase protein TatB n=1 Tax=Teredinibacter turnerae TaxID=2426 RepID=UPI00037A7117|nr:Sec-independent protein translocase protein TatB [Teredinibacter turnerae]